MKTKGISLNAIACLIIVVFFCILACDNGSSLNTSSSSSSGLVKVSLTIDEKSSGGLQKSISVTSDIDLGSLDFYYNAVPQWSGTDIQGATDWTLISYDPQGQNQLGYFTPGLWKFGVQIRKGNTVVYNGYTDESVSTSSVAVTVVVSKMIDQGSAGSVSVSVTAPTVDAETMTVAWSGTATGSAAATATPLGNGTTQFDYALNSLSPGNYTFTLSHPLGGSGSAVAFELRPGERVEITGFLENGVFQIGYITVKIYTITIEKYNWGGTEQDPKYCGNIRINTVSAAQGELVSFDVEPADGGGLAEALTVTSGGNQISYSATGNHYTFAMPDGDVTINVKFENVDTEIEIEDLKRAVQVFYSTNNSVTAFGRSDTPPSGEDSIKLKDVRIWYDSTSHKICWYSQSGTLKLKAGSMAGFFQDCSNYTSIIMTGINTSLVTSMASLFQNCTKLTELDVAGLDTSACTDMSYMFAYCGLDGFPYSGNTSTDYNHTNPIALDVSSFDTSKVTNMDHMFYLCNTESELQVSGWDVSKVTNMSYLFGGDWIQSGSKHYFTHLTVDSVKNWNTSSCTNFRSTFDFCSRITSLDLSGTGKVGSGWDFSRATTVNRMFDCCINLETLVLPKRTVLDSLTEDGNFGPNAGMCYMLSDCKKLDISDFTDILSRLDIEVCKANVQFNDLNNNKETGNRITKNTVVLNNYNGQRRTFCTYGHDEPNVYLGGNGSGVSDVNKQRIVLISP